MDEERIFQWIGIVTIGMAISISGYFRRRAAGTGERISQRDEEGLALFLPRVIFALAMWASVIAYLINPGWMSWAQFSLPGWLRWTGAGFLALCPSLIYWLFRSLGNNVTSTVAIRKEHQLVTHGPYRWIRHPLYTFGTLAILGLGLMAANWFILGTALITDSVLYLRTFKEEERLVDRFGDEYREYMQKTGRFLPKLF